MIFHTPPLSTKVVPVVPLLFKAQLPDTLNVLRQAVPDWVAAHVTAEPAKRGSTPQEIKAELLAQLKGIAAAYDPVWALTDPQIPPNTVVTLVPDRIRPAYASQYEHWKFIWYKESRDLLKEFFDRALGGIPDGPVSVGDALLKGKIRGTVALEGWTGSLGIPTFKRTMEAILDPDARAVFWDGSFGYESTGQAVLTTADMVLGLFGAKGDRLYFDARDWSWFVCAAASGTLRAGVLG
jgi:hypothetical protein